MPHKVRNKAWFGAQKSFRSLLHDWTIQTVAVDSMLDYVLEAWRMHIFAILSCLLVLICAYLGFPCKVPK